ncbi:MAG: hypothetical protein O7F71_20390 [Gammaproteobacteria bacterium]|nr:hypothetical protein [Gammaproteobacteria bacterium]
MERAIQIFVALPGVMMGLQAIGWLIDPKGAAEGLGMPLLEGVARSTQIGDMTSFFAALSVMVLLGAIRKNATWLGAAAMVLGGAAIFRTTAWMFHGAELATQFIVPEVVLTVVLCFGVYRYSRPAATD